MSRHRLLFRISNCASMCKASTGLCADAGTVAGELLTGTPLDMGQVPSPPQVLSQAAAAAQPLQAHAVPDQALPDGIAERANSFAFTNPLPGRPIAQPPLPPSRSELGHPDSRVLSVPDPRVEAQGHALSGFHWHSEAAGCPRASSSRWAP
jgi:hypothetical protein